uniref:Uncharacterized protein n=1 Tax=Plectus sambesii TaxID=2011161 RepID=A0A914XIU9_9BILA
STYGRYRLQHTSTNDLRRGSRAVTTHLMARNGSAVSSVNDKSKNSIQPTTMTVLTGSGCHSNGNGGGGGGGRPPDYRTVMAEMTPLKQKRRKNSSDDDEDYSSDESNHNRRLPPFVGDVAGAQ